MRDWLQGHRKSCPYHCKARFSRCILGPCNRYDYEALCSGEIQHLTTRDRSFIRALFDDDYSNTETRQEIFRRQISFLRANPSAQFYVLLLYTGDCFSIRVKQVSNNPGFSAEQWADYVLRSKNSDGRMELHVMVVESDTKPHARMIPMRSNSSRIYEEIKRIAGSVNPDGFQQEEYSDTIAQLVAEQDDEVLYIH